MISKNKKGKYVMSNRKKVIIIIAIVMLLICIYEILRIYALFQSNAEGEVEIQTASWNILVNDTDLTNGTEEKFTITSLEVEEAEGVAERKTCSWYKSDILI